MAEFIMPSMAKQESVKDISERIAPLSGLSSKLCSSIADLRSTVPSQNDIAVICGGSSLASLFGLTGAVYGIIVNANTAGRIDGFVVKGNGYISVFYLQTDNTIDYKIITHDTITSTSVASPSSKITNVSSNCWMNWRKTESKASCDGCIITTGAINGYTKLFSVPSGHNPNVETQVYLYNQNDAKVYLGYITTTGEFYSRTALPVSSSGYIFHTNYFL